MCSPDPGFPCPAGRRDISFYDMSPPGTPTLRDYRALAHFRHLLRKFLRFSEKAAKEAGLPARQHQLLLAAKGVPEGELPTIGALARMLQLRHHSTVELAARLERRGMVERFRSESDRRRVFIRITARGERVLEALSLRHREELRSARVGLIRALMSLFDDAAEKTVRRKARS
jgi:DNA-binding MarR family transcriptional regulator